MKAIKLGEQRLPTHVMVKKDRHVLLSFYLDNKQPGQEIQMKVERRT
jgi:hypothetical protein